MKNSCTPNGQLMYGARVTYSITTIVDSMIGTSCKVHTYMKAKIPKTKIPSGALEHPKEKIATLYRCTLHGVHEGCSMECTEFSKVTPWYIYLSLVLSHESYMASIQYSGVMMKETE